MPDHLEGMGSQEPDEEQPYSKTPKLRKGEKAAIRERLHGAQKYYEKRFEKNAVRCRDLWRGNHWLTKRRQAENRPYLVVNYLQHVVETIVGSITYSNPRVVMKPESPLGLENLEFSQRATNWGYREANAHRETKRAYKDCWVYGFGVVATTWLQELKTTPAIEGRQPVAGEPPDPDAVLEAVEKGEELTPPVDPAEVVEDRPLVKRLDPRQFRIPPEADWVIDDAPWCGFVEVRPLDEIQADPRYRRGITRRLKGSTKSTQEYLSEEYRDKKEDEIPSDVKRVCLKHYYEMRRRLHVVLADDEPEPILVEEWYWKHERYPFRLVFAPRLEDEFYPDPPPLIQWEHMQKEINLARSQLATHRARYNRKYLAWFDSLSPDAEKKLESGEDGQLIKVQRKGGALEDQIRPLVDAPMQAEVMISSQVAIQDLNAISTVDQYQMGMAPTKRMTQTEVSAVQGAGGARQKTAAQDYEELCAGVAEDIFDLMQQFSTRTLQLPIYGPQDQVAGFEPVTKDQIQGDYHVTVYVGSTEVKNQQGMIEQIGFLLQALQPYAAAGVINIKPLLEQLLVLMPEIKDVQAIVGEPAMMGPGGPPQPGLPPEAGGAPPEGGVPPQIPDNLLAQLIPQGPAPAGMEG